MAAITSSPAPRSASRAARHPGTGSRSAPGCEVAHKSLTDFILDSACLGAEQTLLDQRLFLVSGSQCQALMELLERPAQPNEGLRDLFSRKAPWGCQMSLCGPDSLEGRHQLESFDCGKPALNEWLLRHARQAQGGSAKTFVVAENDRVVGYFSLTVGQVDTLEAPERIRKEWGSTRSRLLSWLGWPSPFRIREKALALACFRMRFDAHFSLPNRPESVRC